MKSTFFSIAFTSLSVISCLSFMTSCKKDSDSPKEGKANITLTVGAQQINITGSCGWATAAGVHYIGAKDSNNSLRVFEVNFNMENPPSVTSSYILVDDMLDETPTHVWMTVTEIMGGSFIEWTSFDGSGTLLLTVSGDKVTANLSGITLESGSGNASPYNGNGTLSGTLEFYRE